MAKDASGKSPITRVDLRIPNHLFEEIEKLAIQTNQPVHHRTGKIITTPVILNLIQLGLKKIKEGETIPLDSISSKDSLREAELEKKILNTLLPKIEGIVSDKVADAILTLKNRLSDSQSDDKSDNNVYQQIKEIFLADELEDNQNHPVEEVTETNTNLPDNNTSNVTDNLKHNNIKPLETESSFTFEDTIAHINNLNSQGLNYAQIAKKLTDTYPTKQGKYKWTGTQVKRILEKK